MRALMDSLWVATSNPSTRPWPLDGVMIPHSMRMVVVLPDPFGPRNANTSPSLTSSDRRSTAIRSPYIFVNSRASTATGIRLVQRLAEPIGAQPKHHQAEDRQRQDLWPQHLHADAFEDDAAQNLQKVGQRNQQSQVANRVGHAFARENEPRQDDRRQHDEQRQLHRLRLRLRHRRDQQPQS